MNYKTIRNAFLICALIFTGATGLALAESHPSENSPNFTSGQPGKVFFYEQTFGETEAPYLADPDHLHIPQGVGLDATGNLWVTESARALKYTPNGSFLMSIDWASPGWQADETHFINPHDVAIDSTGNIWIADPGSHRVIKFDPAGNYLMQLGITWAWGPENTVFNGPMGVALDSLGNLYVSDYYNQRVQVFDSTGSYSTTIGVTEETGCDNAHFNGPYHIAIDDSDNLYVADNGNHRVQIFDANHVYTATLGECGVPGSDNDHFSSPFGVAVDADRIYVSEGNNRVQIFNRGTLDYQTTLGTGGGSGDYQFEGPNDIAVDSAGNLYVADQWNHRVQKYNNSRAYVRTFGTTGVPYLTDGHHYNQPVDVAVDTDGNIAIVEGLWGGGGERLIKLTAGGLPLFTIGEPGVSGSDSDHVSQPFGVAFDASGKIYVADCGNHRVQIFSSDGVWGATLGSGPGTGDYEFNCPSGVAFDGSGNIYVTDANNHRVQVFDSNRVYKATLGVTGESGWDNNHFNWPNDVEVDASGNIYVADTLNHRVQIFDSSRVWQQKLGSFGSDNDHFWEPYGVAVDPAGNLFVAEKFNPRVQVFDSNWNYRTTIGGVRGNQPDQFRQLYGVDVDKEGNVYVADLLNHRVEKYVPGKLLFLPLAVRGLP
jgi:sugar lactone lactonase YvrE